MASYYKKLNMGAPCPQFSPCWCQQHPTHKKCQPVGVPIDGGIIYLLLAGILLTIITIKKLKYETNNN